MHVNLPVQEPKKSNHQAKVVRIDEVLPHPDPETTSLELIHIGGYQVVVRKGSFKAGDLGVYIQPDSVVPVTKPFAFLFPNGEATTDSEAVPVKYRRITVRKFRKAWSEGLLLPVTDFDELYVCSTTPQEGQDVSDLLGITHYDPDTEVAGTHAPSAHAPKKKFRYPRTLKGWLRFLWHFVKGPKSATRDVSFTIPTYDVEAFKNYKNTFAFGEPVIVTEKIHGSNARYIFLDGEMYIGSKNQWKATGGDDVWNKALKNNPWIETFCRAYPGYALYGEVTPTQKGFDYGSKNAQFFVFDVLNPDKQWLNYYDAMLMLYSSGAWAVGVPVLYAGPYDEDLIAGLIDGKTQVPSAYHIREGIVVKTERERSQRGLGRAQLKIVSNSFLEKDSK